MAFEPDRVRTVTFDSYSTLVDVDATVAALADHADIDDPDPISRTWRERSMQYTLVANHLESYETFYEINRDALAYALAAHDIDLPADEREEILAVYHELEVFDDVRESIERLHEAGYDTYVLSNGNPDMLDSMVEHADIGDLVVDTISADELGTFKPDADLYRHAAGRTGTPLDELVHVSALWFDVQGAIHAGMQGVWLDRKGTPWEPFGAEPDLITEGLVELADRLEE
ncbi:haloacid dehalogenase type II [Natrinema salsiterrestre]|uniref:Haloacid dehalogenase type II n=1 Tax=Natrinema salsiterrestre TaxID=2950540 RepID=A0A9Q4L7Z5_9EURY|nr:haloacid dehalogenase type II [Natrinema salsiterrestre]MDF9747635.1 haloacid dehalogenase type II [Natrinema salsiterrestre]